MPRSEFLSFSPPCLSDAEVRSVNEVLHQGQWLSSGPKTKAFELSFKEYVQAEDALALNSCTAGLQLAMVLNQIGPGDEVITSPMTFVATANVVEHEGGTVVLADIDPETLLIDPRQIEQKISAKTKVIVPVHYAGQPCDMPSINTLARAHSCAVVEDAAHCMPSKIGDQWIGGGGNLTLFSFYATKNMTTGEGGMMTGPKDLIERARVLALHGMSRNAWDRFAKGASWKYDVERPGFKFNMTDMAAALGLVQLERLNELYERRMRIVRLYEQAFQGSKYFTPLKTRVGLQSSHHLYVIQLNLAALKISRDDFIVQMHERNIGCSVHYWPVHRMSYYAKKYGWTPDSFPNATRAGERIVSLPLNSKMSEHDAADVIEAVMDICLQYQR